MPVFFFPWQLLDLWKTSSGKSTCSTLEGKNSHKPMTEVVSLTIKYVHGCKYTLRIHHDGKQVYYQLKRLLMFSITSKHPPVARHTWMLVCLDNALVTEWICDKKESHCLILHVMLKIFRKESTTSSFSKWKKTLNRDCLHCIGDFCAIVSNIFSKEVISNNTKCRKQMLKFIWNPWKYWWNDTDDEILPVFAQFLWTLKFISSSSCGKLFLVLFQATVFIFSF